MSEKEDLSMTARDWEVVLNNIIALAVMGTVVIEVHPVRFALYVAAAARHGGPFAPEAMTTDDAGVVEAMVAGLIVSGKTLEVVVRMWKPCAKVPCEGCDRVAAQGANYPTPEEPSLIRAPGRTLIQ